MNNLPPAVAYGRIDPRKKPAAASIRPPTRPDAGLASSVGNSTGYSRAHAASTFWILVRVCGSPEISACVWSMTGGTSRLSPRSRTRSEEHTSELQSQSNLVCRLLLEKKKKKKKHNHR